MSFPRRSISALLVLALFACGSPSGAGGGSSSGGELPTSWEGLTTSDLVVLVRREAATRIHEADPSLDAANRAAWAASPDTAPPLGDRVCEQLLNLAITDLASGDLDAAERTVRLVRARARNRNSAFAGNSLLSVVARRRASEGAEAGAVAENAGRDAVAAILRELPRARFGASTVLFQLYQEPTQVDAMVEQVHGQLVSLETAVTALFAEALLRDVVANRATYLDAIGVVRAENDARPADPDYAFSTVDLTGASDAHEVLVAVWDTGTEGNLFPSQLFTNAAETANGADDDGNGIVDDIHGVIADPDPAQTGLIFDPGAATLAEYAPFLRGVMDLRAGMASTDAAQRVLALMRSATDGASLELLESNLDAVGEWGHGTHVAGILLAGLPQARLAVFRSAWAGETRIYRHRGPTDAEVDAERANVDAIAAFINTHHVRVVNASLGFTRDYLEDELRHESSVYSTDAEVRARAEAVHARRRENWAAIFAACPDTLFVVAAGNSNRDVVEYGDVSASLEAPNLLVVGAVDRFGNWATFTNSNPERVRLFDFGVEVDSVIPNGEHVPLSGTSMASPNAANLAAKILSVAPTLEPASVISIMLETGDPIAPPFSGVVANEAAALARARLGTSR